MSAVPGARAVDAVLEATVVGSFTRIGYQARRRLFRWPPLDPGALTGKTVVVTGGGSGIGRAAAEALAGLGALVCIVGRDPGRTERARAEIAAAAGCEVEGEVADLSLLAETAALAERIAARHERVHALVLNAGALLHERVLTAEGNETTLATHVLSPFLLTQALWPQLEAAAPSRVVFVASGGMYTQPLDVDGFEPPPGDYDGPTADYDGPTAYARCKRAQVALAGEWTRRFPDAAVTVDAMHPGWVDTAAIRDALPRFSRLLGPLLRTPGEGADTIVWLASASGAPVAGGQFFLDRRPRPLHRLPSTRRSDEAREAGRLWELCRERAARRAAPYHFPE